MLTGEKKKEYNRQYHAKNRAKLIENMNKAKKCECCDREYPTYQYYKHCKSKKHLTNLEIFKLKKKLEKINDTLLL